MITHSVGFIGDGHVTRIFLSGWKQGNALPRMICGAARTLLSSGFTSAQVMDLIPARPLAKDEAAIKQVSGHRTP